MKKKIESNEEMLSKFQGSEISALSTITGGVSDVGNTMTLDYTTSSSKDDSDRGDHDSDAD